MERNSANCSTMSCWSVSPGHGMFTVSTEKVSTEKVSTEKVLTGG